MLFRSGMSLDKFRWQNMCCTLDFEVAEILGGEDGLKALCDRAAEKGVRIISWMSSHYAPHTALNEDSELGHGDNGVFAARESGRHPDTGYPADCWPINLNAPVFEKVREQVLGVCERTGLAGFLWDSYCNLGWWQVDYSDGSMRPQFDRQAELYAEMANSGLYLQPEALVTFSNGSCIGLHGGNVYQGELGFSYNTVIGMRPHGSRPLENQILRGEKPIDELFRCFAHRRSPSLSLHQVPREEWDAEAEREIKELLGVYREVRPLMQKRTVLPDDAGVLWENEDGESPLFFAFRRQDRSGCHLDVATGEERVDGPLLANRVYRVLHG